MGIVISQFAGGAPSPLLSLYDGFLNTRRTNCKVLFHQASVRAKAACSCMLCNEMRQNGLFTPDIGKSCDRIYNAWQNSCAILAICERGRATAGRLGLGQTSRERQQARACICGKVSKAEGRDARCAPPRPQSLERRLPRPITGSRCCHGSIPRCALLRDPCHTRGRRACSIATHLDNWAGSSSHPAAHRRHAALGKSCTELSQKVKLP